ncbi:MAG: hypothetical protein U0625_05800 [Phycisphaerales bacterium]
MSDIPAPRGPASIDEETALAFIEGELDAAREAALLATLPAPERAWLESMRADRALLRAEEVPPARFDLTEAVLAAVERQELFGAGAARAEELPTWNPAPLPAPVRWTRWVHRPGTLAAAASVALLAFVGGAWLIARGGGRSAPADAGATLAQATTPAAPAGSIAQSLAAVPPLPALPPVPAAASHNAGDAMLDFVVVVDAASDDDAERLLARALSGVDGAAVVANFAPEELRTIERASGAAFAGLSADAGAGAPAEPDVRLPQPLVGSDLEAAEIQTRLLLASEGATHTISVPGDELSAVMGALARLPGVSIDDRGADAQTWSIPERARFDVPVYVRVRGR